MRNPVPDARQLAWHQKNRYGFIHFGLNTFTGREWGFGDESPDLFCPDRLDCGQWVKAAKAGGLSGLILTAKHHDGFCLWPTKTTSHHLGRSPFRQGKGDLVRELADACRQGGLDFGLYCSPWDRHQASYGRAAYVDLYHRQWQELASRYGSLFECWFDGAHGGSGHYGGDGGTRSIDPETYYRYETLWQQIRALQPRAVCFSDAGPDVRWCGNERGMVGLTHWAKVRPEGFAPGDVKDGQRLATGDADGTVWRPAECDVSLRPGWFWHEDESAKSPQHLFEIWLASVGRGASLNLNLTPDRSGRIPPKDIESLTAWQAMIQAFTAEDLAPQSRLQASSTAAGKADHLADPDPETFWQASGRQGQVVMDFGREVFLGGIGLQEAIAHGQSVESFAVDLLSGNAWYECARGTTIGAYRLFKLENAVGRALRLRLLQSQRPPALTRLAAYARQA